MTVVRLGLTGGIGSGKSTVARMLSDHGAVWVDADALSRASTAAGGRAIPAIRHHFGDDFIDAQGAMDRDRMRQAVFNDPAARVRLEQIVHPLVREAIEAACQRVTQGVIILDLPLLAESDTWRRRLDTIWVVDCPVDTQVQRVMQRNGWPQEQVLAVIAAQASRDQRLALADTVICNDSDWAALQAHVAKAWQGLKDRFGL